MLRCYKMHQHVIHTHCLDHFNLYSKFCSVLCKQQAGSGQQIPKHDEHRVILSNENNNSAHYEWLVFPKCVAQMWKLPVSVKPVRFNRFWILGWLSSVCYGVVGVWTVFKMRCLCSGIKKWLAFISLSTLQKDRVRVFLCSVSKVTEIW